MRARVITKGLVQNNTTPTSDTCFASVDSTLTLSYKVRTSSSVKSSSYNLLESVFQNSIPPSLSAESAPFNQLNNMSAHSHNMPPDAAKLRGVHGATLPPTYNRSENSEFHDVPWEKTAPIVSEPRRTPGGATPRQRLIGRIFLGLVAILAAATVVGFAVYSIKYHVIPDFMSGNSTSKVATSHQVSSSSAPFLERRSVQGCWDNILCICANDAQVPADRESNGFGECAETYQYIYCGLIMRQLSSGNANAAAAPEGQARLMSVKPSILGRASNKAGARAVADFSTCYNMLDFCIESQMQAVKRAPRARVIRERMANPEVTIKLPTITASESTAAGGLLYAAAVTERAVPTTAAAPDEASLMKTWIK